MGVELLLLAVPNEYSYKRKYVEEQGDKIKVLLLGHSHIANGVDPALLGDSAFNMAISGRAHHYDAVLAERYIPRLKNLKCVIWPLGYNFQYHSYIDPCTFRKIRQIDANYQCMYEKYMGISYEPLIPYRHWPEVIYSTGNLGMRFFTKNVEDKINCTPLGYQKILLAGRSNDWQEQQLPPQVHYDSPNAPLAKQEGLKDMKRIAAVCRRAGVRLVVITMPCHSSYLERMTERGKREMRECVEAMREVYPAMEYYNFIDDSRFSADDFINSSHICDKGAEKFSGILKDTLGL